MKRRTLDIVLSAGGGAVAIALLVLGIVFARDASFARNYVSDQLSEQGITFTPAEALSEEEAQAECLVQNAGQQVTTGKQAECYANEYIGLHLQEMADGETYATLGGPQRELRTQLADAQANNAGNVEVLQIELDEITSTRDTLFKGETLRGLLLTTYGFSVFGEKAAQAAIVLLAIAGILGLLSVAGFTHAYITPRGKKVQLDKVLGANGHPAEPKAAPATRPKPRGAGTGTAPKGRAVATRKQR